MCMEYGIYTWTHATKYICSSYVCVGAGSYFFSGLVPGGGRGERKALVPAGEPAGQATLATFIVALPGHSALPLGHA